MTSSVTIKVYVSDRLNKLMALKNELDPVVGGWSLKSCANIAFEHGLDMRIAELEAERAGRQEQNIAKETMRTG